MKLRRSAGRTAADLLPPRLRAGSRVALVAPAGPVDEESIDAAMQRCESFGFEPVLAPHARARLGYLAGADGERAADLQHAIDDPGLDAIWALRGGYGTLRILDRINPSSLLKQPKAFIGFSDNTALHALLGGIRLPTFHGPHAGNPFPDFTLDSFRRILFQAEPAGLLPFPADGDEEPPLTLVAGRAEGPLAGGNLSLLGALCGTRWAPDFTGRILVLEDVGEAAYRIDRTWTQLRLAGCLNGVVGVVLGRFTNRPEKPEDLPFHTVLRELVGSLGVPVLGGAPFGHVDRQWTLPLGIRARLDAAALTLEILEPAVR